MLKIYRHRPISIEWSVFRSRGVLEDFRDSKLYVWLCGASDRYQIAVDVANPLVVRVPADLPVGDYSLVLMWSKHNYQTLIRNGKMVDDALCKTQIDGVFALVDVGESSEVANLNTVQLRCSSLTGVYGYDGLDAYQIAVIRGFVGSESEWLKSQRYVKVLDQEGDSVTETMSQRATTDALEKIRSALSVMGDKLGEALIDSAKLVSDGDKYYFVIRFADGEKEPLNIDFSALVDAYDGANLNLSGRYSETSAGVPSAGKSVDAVVKYLNQAVVTAQAAANTAKSNAAIAQDAAKEAGDMASANAKAISDLQSSVLIVTETANNAIKSVKGGTATGSPITIKAETTAAKAVTVTATVKTVAIHEATADADGLATAKGVQDYIQAGAMAGYTTKDEHTALKKEVTANTTAISKLGETYLTAAVASETEYDEWDAIVAAAN